MAKIDVGYTDNGLVVLTITEPTTGAILHVPLQPQESFTLGESLILAANTARNGRPAQIILPTRRQANGT